MRRCFAVLIFQTLPKRLGNKRLEKRCDILSGTSFQITFDVLRRGQDGGGWLWQMSSRARVSGGGGQDQYGVLVVANEHPG